MVVKSYFFNFDNKSGKVFQSGLIDLTTFGSGFPYGLEFSPNSKFLYYSQYTNYGGIFQIDCSEVDSAKIYSSFLIIYTGNKNDGFSSLQVGIDNKIYISRNAKYFGRINYPDRKGNDCDYIDNFFNF
jgi:hypothetical protein